jgi:hypothetical protein
MVYSSIDPIYPNQGLILTDQSNQLAAQRSNSPSPLGAHQSKTCSPNPNAPILLLIPQIHDQIRPWHPTFHFQSFLQLFINRLFQFSDPFLLEDQDEDEI